MKLKLPPKEDFKENWTWYVKLGFFIFLIILIFLWFVENLWFYSYLKASTGFNLEACLEGKNPEPAPTKKANNKQPIINHNGKYGLNKPRPAWAAI